MPTSLEDARQLLMHGWSGGNLSGRMEAFEAAVRADERARVLPDRDGAELPYDVHLAAAHWAQTKALELYPPGEPTTPDPDEPLTYEDGAQSGYVAGYQAARVLGPAAEASAEPAT